MNQNPSKTGTVTKTAVYKLELSFKQRGRGDRSLEAKIRTGFRNLVKGAIPIVERAVPFEAFAVGLYQQRSGKHHEMIGCRTYFRMVTSEPAKLRAILAHLAEQSRPKFRSLLDRDVAIEVTPGYDSGDEPRTYDVDLRKLRVGTRSMGQFFLHGLP